MSYIVLWWICMVLLLGVVSSIKSVINKNAAYCQTDSRVSEKSWDKHSERNKDIHIKKKSTLKLKHFIKQFQQKQNITTFMKAALIAGLLYSTASVLARCN